ncbi:glycosyltransferase [Escherichia coli]|uniref:glycosyltransferase n=1 Tax=Escherichia coli TaxID=562 RepID=UPI003EB8B053
MKFEGQKRVKDLLDGLSQAKGNWKLHVLGDGSDFEKCQAYGRELNIDDRIVWYGWQQYPGNWSSKILKSECVIAHVIFEGFPMTLLEALSWGFLVSVPIVSRAC